MSTNWKTTATGIGLMLIQILTHLIPVLPPAWATVATGLVAGLGLIFAKDSNVTGGSVQQ